MCRSVHRASDHWIEQWFSKRLKNHRAAVSLLRRVLYLVRVHEALRTTPSRWVLMIESDGLAICPMMFHLTYPSKAEAAESEEAAEHAAKQLRAPKRPNAGSPNA
jgi:hypothetical protein